MAKVRRTGGAKAVARVDRRIARSIVKCEAFRFRARRRQLRTLISEVESRGTRSIVSIASAVITAPPHDLYTGVCLE